MQLTSLLKDTNYNLSQFNEKQITELEQAVFMKAGKNGDVPYVKCLVRKKDIRLTPEEAVRQLYLLKLHQDYNYPYERMELEYAVTFGREKKRADIVIFERDNPTVVYIIVELKKPKLKDGKEQLKSYCNATGDPSAYGPTATVFPITTAAIPTISKIFQISPKYRKSCPTYWVNAGQ